MITFEDIQATIEQAVTVLEQTWHYDAWLYLSEKNGAWRVEHAAGCLDLCVGDVFINQSDSEFPFFEGAVRYPSVISAPYLRNGVPCQLQKIQASIMHPLVDNRGNCFALFVGVARRGVSREYDKALPLLSVMGEMVMQSRELLLAQQQSQLNKNTPPAFSREDALTRTYNRRGWSDALSLIKEKMQRTPAMHGVLLMNVNDMKKINDMQGHDAGDSYLVHIAEVVRPMLGHGDMLARIGGDEFAVLIVNSTEEQMQAFNDALRASFAQNMINCATGFSVFSRPETMNTAIDQADMMMYEAKRAMKKCMYPTSPLLFQNGRAAIA